MIDLSPNFPLSLINFPNLKKSSVVINKQQNAFIFPTLSVLHSAFSFPIYL